MISGKGLLGIRIYRSNISCALVGDMKLCLATLAKVAFDSFNSCKTLRTVRLLTE